MAPPRAATTTVGNVAAGVVSMVPAKRDLPGRPAR